MNSLQSGQDQYLFMIVVQIVLLNTLDELLNESIRLLNDFFDDLFD